MDSILETRLKCMEETIKIMKRDLETLVETRLKRTEETIERIKEEIIFNVEQVLDECLFPPNEEGEIGEENEDMAEAAGPKGIISKRLEKSDEPSESKMRWDISREEAEQHIQEAEMNGIIGTRAEKLQWGLDDYSHLEKKMWVSYDRWNESTGNRSVSFIKWMISKISHHQSTGLDAAERTLKSLEKKR